MESDHGGGIRRAARTHGIPEADWLDLSTGINPRPWPVPTVPAECWQRLPEPEDGLEARAREWAGVPAGAGVLPVPGTQAVIQHLPRLRAPGRVGVPRPGYSEHARCWRRAGHEVVPLAADEIEHRMDELDVLVWVQPNNPDGRVLDPGVLERWRRELARREGWLVVDEAFADPVPEYSLAHQAGAPGLVMTRSLGKFFGLAGLRAGLFLAWPELCRRLAAELGPWALSHPARWLMEQALADSEWQQSTRAWLHEQAERLDAVLREAGIEPAGGTALFRYCLHPRALQIQQALAEQAILVRAFDDPPALRFGLPADETEMERLARALNSLNGDG